LIALPTLVGSSLPALEAPVKAYLMRNWRAVLASSARRSSFADHHI
jgi:hypothetical protein